FQYQPLTEHDSFRLILLQPASSKSQDLHCTLEYTTIAHCDREIIDHYTALSYIWGDPTKQGRILIDGTSVVITESLDAALRDLRDEKRVLRIWADALCINQQDLEERGTQVKLMGHIYSTAHHTVIHLGSAEANEKLLTTIPSNTSGTLTNFVSSDDLIKTAENTLLKLPWFSRVWIFQELLLSSDPWVQCGAIRARWNQLCRVLLQKTQGRSKQLQVLADMNSARTVHKQRLFRHLIVRRGLGATDPRDMIFAHFGIAADVEALGAYVQVSYEDSCAKIYNDTARYLLDEIGLETLFHHAADTESGSRVEGLASWAPDWSVPSAGLVAMYRNNTLKTKMPKANENCVCLKDIPVLACLGYEVDTIASFSLPLPPPVSLQRFARNEYQQAANGLLALYNAGSGVWWSGDEEGQHRHINLKNREAEHEKLGQVIHDEWLTLTNHDIPMLSSRTSEREMSVHREFLTGFQGWVAARGKEEVITVGYDTDGYESLMWGYLMSGAKESVLTGRRLAITSSGKLAIVPRNVARGDMVVFLAGSLVAYVVR
ncbi:HET-domain-containing protein, partial [Acephala macrosclerotiorum]